MAALLGLSKLKGSSASASASAAAETSPFGSPNKLPEELITEILVRLPVCSLRRFEAVSKAWQSEISSPRFIKLHLKRTTPKETPRCLIVYNFNQIRPMSNQMKELLNLLGISKKCRERPEVRDLITLQCLYHDSKRSIIINITDIGLPRDFRQRASAVPSGFSEMYIGGVINGIVCVVISDKYNKKHIIYLWNPATRQSKELPAPIISYGHHCYFTIGFGFDSDADDYKVIRSMEFSGGVIRAEVYSARDMYWKEIEVELKVESFVRNCNSHVFVDGNLYWLVNEKLVTYNLNKEKFSYEIELPKLQVTGGTERKIVELENKIALSVHSVGDADNIQLSFWTLDKVNGKGCWSKKYMFVAFPDTPSVFTHLNNGNIVAEMKDGSLVLYDTRKKEPVILWLPFEMSTRNVFSYAESLVSIRGSEQLQ